MVKSRRKKKQEVLYYSLLIAVIIFISGLLFLISPLIFFLNNLLFLYIVFIPLGIALSAFLKGFLKELDELTHAHHASLISIIFIICLVNFATLLITFSINTPKNIILSVLSATVFTICFLIPYIYHYLRE